MLAIVDCTSESILCRQVVRGHLEVVPSEMVGNSTSSEIALFDKSYITSNYWSDVIILRCFRDINTFHHN